MRGNPRVFTILLWMKFLEAPESIREFRVFSALPTRVFRMEINWFCVDNAKHSYIHVGSFGVGVLAAVPDPTRFLTPPL